ncbi:MAG: sporulation transcriptional regulator SpoIIID [Clostridia bacterium]|nr:sporulation transcriptional regulator SpoIIID [Clostridia bacterium]
MTKSINVPLSVHKDVTERLQSVNRDLAKKIKMILDENKADRHIRGGLATKQKYENKRKKGA